MKKLLYTLAFTVLGFTASYAQKTKATPEQKAEKSAAAMQQKLSLSDAQKAKIKQIELDRVKQHDEHQKSENGAAKGKMEEKKAAMKAHHEKISEVLTPEQQKVFAAAKAEKKAKMMHKGKDHKGKKHHEEKKAEVPVKM